jgi:hypothetical protein
VRVGSDGHLPPCTSVNDVVLTMCSSALRRYLADEDCRPAKPLIAVRRALADERAGVALRRSRLANVIPPPANVAISNVPGSPVPLFLRGRKRTCSQRVVDTRRVDCALPR